MWQYLWSASIADLIFIIKLPVDNDDDDDDAYADDDENRKFSKEKVDCIAPARSNL